MWLLKRQGRGEQDRDGEKQTSKPDIWDLIISSDGECTASLGKLQEDVGHLSLEKEGT